MNAKHAAKLSTANDVTNAAAKSFSQFLRVARGNGGQLRVAADEPGRELHAGVCALCAARWHADHQALYVAALYGF